MAPRNHPRYGAGPDRIDQTLDAYTDADGTTTVRDRLMQLLEIGNYVEYALKVVGLNKATVYRWRQEAARARAMRAADSSYRFTSRQRQAIRFADELDAAEARAQAHMLALLEREGRGGFRTEVVTEKFGVARKPDGTYEQVLIERTVRAEVSRPNVHAITWRLERRFPDQWGGRQRVELSGPEGGPIEVEDRARALRAHVEQVASASLDNGQALAELN